MWVYLSKGILDEGKLLYSQLGKYLQRKRDKKERKEKKTSLHADLERRLKLPNNLFVFGGLTDGKSAT